MLDPKATGGATIQHLAKLRVKLQEQGKSVPPPLRRLTAASQHTVDNEAESPLRWVPAGTAPSGSQERRWPQSQKRTYQETDEDDEDDEDDDDYSPHPAKRSAVGVKRRTYESTVGEIQGKSPMRGIRGETEKSGAPWSSFSDKIKEPESSNRNAKGKGRATASIGRGRSEMDFMQPAPKDPVEHAKKAKLPVVLKVSPSFRSSRFPHGLSQWAPGVSGPANYSVDDDPEESGPEAFPDMDEDMNEEEYHPVQKNSSMNVEVDEAEDAGEDHTGFAAGGAEEQHEQDAQEAGLPAFGNIPQMPDFAPINTEFSGVQMAMLENFQAPNSMQTSMTTMPASSSELALITPRGSSLPALEPAPDISEFENAYINWDEGPHDDTFATGPLGWGDDAGFLGGPGFGDRFE